MKNSKINQVIEIPITSESYPFGSAEKYYSLSDKGFLEKEYIIDGQANVYKTNSSNQLEIKNSNVNYRNRIIIRAPKDTNSFSGNVVIEILNPTASMDIDRMWIFTKEKIIRDNDIYIGITSKPNVIASLLKFDERRYSTLKWENPTPNTPFPFEIDDAFDPPNINYETGLFWDMLLDLTKFIRANDETNPLKEYKIRNVILSGWSQSACYLLTYINQFANIIDEFDVFDGYFSAGPPRSVTIPINQYEGFPVKDEVPLDINEVRKPLINYQTESENSLFGGYKTRRCNGDRVDYLCREYDIAGSSHDTKDTLIDYYNNDNDLRRINKLPRYEGKEKYPNNYPLSFLIRAGLRNLINWIDYGIAPNISKKIPVDSDGNNRKDALGITKNGLRTCLLDYPTGSYHYASTNSEGGTPQKNILFGHEKPFSANMLIEMYENIENYTSLVSEHCEEQVTKGFILKEEKNDLINFAVNLAKYRGLN